MKILNNTNVEVGFLPDEFSKPLSKEQVEMFKSFWDQHAYTPISDGLSKTTVSDDEVNSKDIKS